MELWPWQKWRAGYVIHLLNPSILEQEMKNSQIYICILVRLSGGHVHGQFKVARVLSNSETSYRD